MMIERFSPKQLRALSWWHRDSPDYGRDAIICDGAVRSGKTFCLSLSFVLWTFYAFGGGVQLFERLQAVEKLDLEHAVPVAPDVGDHKQIHLLQLLSVRLLRIQQAQRVTNTAERQLLIADRRQISQRPLPQREQTADLLQDRLVAEKLAAHTPAVFEKARFLCRTQRIARIGIAAAEQPLPRFQFSSDLRHLL